MLFFENIETPLGQLQICANEKYLLSIDFDIKSIQTNSNEITLLTKKQLTEYFLGERKTFDLPIFLNATPFQKKVWNALLDIPYGETYTYKEIAQIIGTPNGARAVGNANNKNPIPIIIPCHRVVAKNDIGGYAKGIFIKEKLLELEKKYKTK